MVFEMKMELLGTPRLGLEQRLIMTPPISSTTEEMENHAHSVSTSQRKAVSDEVVEAVGDYISTENHTAPYTDRQLFEHAKADGFDVNLREISCVRGQILGLAPSSKRYK